jgi:hypothetical protein
MVESSTSRAGARGRPPRVTAERLERAILEIEGEVPTMASLARQLGVGVATLYSHVRGQEELRRLAADVVFDAWALPPAPPGIHWAHWLLECARDARRMIERYPAVHGARPLAGGQLRYVERVQVVLLILGVGAQIEATRLEEARAGLELWGLFQEALSSHPGELPVLGGLQRDGIPALDTAFDELVWFTLTGIARRRGEVLPTQLPSASSAA